MTVEVIAVDEGLAATVNDELRGSFGVNTIFVGNVLRVVHYLARDSHGRDSKHLGTGEEFFGELGGSEAG